MCGTIRKSTSPEQAVEYAIAYAISEEKYDGLDKMERRRNADSFINNYVSASQRTKARALLAGRSGVLTTELDYHRDVVD